MKLESAIRILAGSLVLTSLALGHWVSPWWHLLGVFVGVNLIQSALTGFCPAEILLKRLGVGGTCCAGPSPEGCCAGGKTPAMGQSEAGRPAGSAR